MFLNIQFLYVHHQAAVIQKIQLLHRIVQQLGWEGTLTISLLPSFGHSLRVLYPSYIVEPELFEGYAARDWAVNPLPSSWSS